MPRPSAVHWVRENAQERSPFRVLVLDTETRPLDGSAQGHEVLRLWCARLVRRAFETGTISRLNTPDMAAAAARR